MKVLCLVRATFCLIAGVSLLSLGWVKGRGRSLGSVLLGLSLFLTAVNITADREVTSVGEGLFWLPVGWHTVRHSRKSDSGKAYEVEAAGWSGNRGGCWPSVRFLFCAQSGMPQPMGCYPRLEWVSLIHLTKSENTGTARCLSP